MKKLYQLWKFVPLMVFGVALLHTGALAALGSIHSASTTSPWEG